MDIHNAKHVHFWGAPWTHHFKIFSLSKEQQLILVDACEKLDHSLVLNNPLFTSLITQVDDYIKEHRPVFFKLSTLSAKDVDLDDGLGPSLKAINVNRMFQVICRSFRLLDELDSDEHFSLVLRKWDDRITKDNEYRCIIIDRRLEAIAKMSDSSDPIGIVKDKISEYITNNSNLFPEDNVALDLAVYNDTIIFIEFNPVDDELDTYNILSRPALLSIKAMLAINSRPKN